MYSLRVEIQLFLTTSIGEMTVLVAQIISEANGFIHIIPTLYLFLYYPDDEL